jgi:hypothetical protein
MPLGDRDWAGAATWLLSAALVLYLALENGGYDPIPRDQVGIAVWWVLLLGVAVEALPLPGRTRAARAALGLLLGFAVWTALSLSWTQNAERTAAELARVVTYLGVFALGICLVTRRRAGARQLLHGVTFGLAAVAALGVLSRLHMAWFPANELGGALPGIEIERRLAYPLGYSSAMGALAGMTLPLLLAATASARTLAGKASPRQRVPEARLTIAGSAGGGEGSLWPPVEEELKGRVAASPRLLETVPSPAGSPTSPACSPATTSTCCPAAARACPTRCSRPAPGAA